MPISARLVPVATAMALALMGAGPALAVDLSVSSFEISQGYQNATGTTTLVAQNATIVRVKVSLNGQATPQAGVDAVLRIYSNGVEIPTSPVYSTNGPINAPVSPNSANINDTINFHCLPPQSNDIDFVVTVNPFRTVVETNYANNTLAVNNKVFNCRKFVDIAYTPINYTFGGAGLPDPAVTQPGVGDAFLRGIFKTGDWNYHRSPLPAPVLATDINASNAALLNTLNTIRQTQIPAAGYQRPEFIYGWLPGNPFSGNGQAIGIPGAAAFGNTESSRFQRTFAHEIGHCWGLSHNTNGIGVVCFDVEHQLREPLNIAQVMPTTKKDVMYAGLNTVDAWTDSGTYLDCITDARSACGAFGGEQGEGGGASDSLEALGAGPVLRISGVHDHVLRRVALDPAMPNELVVPTADDPAGNVLVESFDARGARLSSVRVDTRACRESCADPSHRHRLTSLYVNLPRWTGGREAARVVVREFDQVPGRPLAELVRSRHAPVVSMVAAQPAADGPLPAPFDPATDRLEGRVRLAWTAQDADGDALVADLLYSPDGGNAWLPVAVGVAMDGDVGSFDFDSADLPASRGANGRFRVRVSDGLGSDDAEMPQSMLLGNSAPPDIHIIAPNTNTTWPQGASVILHGSGWDIDDQAMPDGSLAWISSRDGVLGTGRFLVVRNLSVGAHVVTLRGTDSGGLTSERTITITVSARNFNRADLNGDGLVNGEDLALLLNAWSGSGSSPGLADLNLDGLVNAVDLGVLLNQWGS